jgi:hypothetical protein
MMKLTERIAFSRLVAWFLVAGLFLLPSVRADWYTIFKEDFEGSTDSWFVEDRNSTCDGDTWGVSSYKARAGEKSFWCAQVGFVCGSTTDPNADHRRYDRGQQSIAWAGGDQGFDLTGYAGARLRLNAIVMLNDFFNDSFTYGVSLDRMNYYGTTITTSNPSWQELTLDLANVPGLGSVIGESQVWIALVFHSDDDSKTAEGVYVDEIYLEYMATPVPTSTPPTPTPGAPNLSIDLQLSQDMFQAGDPFILMAVLTNHGAGNHETDMYVILDVYGNYWFYPSWSQTIDKFRQPFWHKAQYVRYILDFIWPEVDSTADGIRFWGAITAPNNVEIIYSTDMVEFGYRAAPTATPTPSPTPPLYTPTPLPSGVPSPSPTPFIFDFVLPGSQFSLNTGIEVTAGERLIFDADGWVCFHVGDCDATRVGPNGYQQPCYDLECAQHPYNPGYDHAALIGRIGNGAYFLVGEHLDTTASGSGPLLLYINDWNCDDNGGQFEGTILFPDR